MQQSCANTFGGFADSPSEDLNPEELTTEEAGKVMEGAGKQPAFNVTTAKKHRTVGSFPFYYVEILILQLFNPRNRNILIRWSAELHQTRWMSVLHQTRWMSVMKNIFIRWMD